MSFPTRVSIALATLAVAAVTHAQEAPAPTTTTVIRAARLIDGTGSAPIRTASSSSPAIDHRRGTQRLGDGSGRRADDRPRRRDAAARLHRRAHAHHRARPRRSGQRRASVRDFDDLGAILGVGNAERTLMAGFTTIRNVGAGNFDDIALQQGDQRRHGQRPAHAERRRTRSASPAATATKTGSSPA